MRIFVTLLVFVVWCGIGFGLVSYFDPNFWAAAEAEAMANNRFGDAILTISAIVASGMLVAYFVGNRLRLW